MEDLSVCDQSEWRRNKWMNDSLNFILIHIKIVCHSKLHQFNCNLQKIAFDATHVLCRYTLAESHCYMLKPVASFESAHLITSVSCLNWQQLLLVCRITSRLFLPGISRSLWFDPFPFLEVSPLALKHVVTTYPVLSRSFGERTSPGPLCYHAFAHVLSSA